MSIAAWSSCGRRIVAGLVGGAFIMSQAPVALAQAGSEKPSTVAATPVSSVDIASAKKHYAAGEKKYKAGDFAGALSDFKEANDIKSTPQAERYLGLCEDALGHYSAAADWYDQFLGNVPAKMLVQGDEIRKRVGEIRAMPGKLRIESTPPAADVTIDGTLQSAPTPLDVELAPGAHQVTLRHAGRLPAERAVTVAFASSQALTVDLAPEPPPVAPVAAAPAPAPLPTVAPPPAEPRSLVPAYITGALAVAAAGVGTVFGVLTLNDKASFNRNPTTTTADNGDTHALIADMSFGVAITLGVTSVVLFATKDEAPPATSRARSKTKTAHVRDKTEHGVSWSPVPIVGAHWGGGGVVLSF
jgi:PEGA domain-containing protein